ncbi:MAG: M1 family metallopeptidase [Saprospiraceae bacterium]|nr:M1 family metallopeptidase [Saprospiraceae bacterium]
MHKPVNLLVLLLVGSFFFTHCHTTKHMVADQPVPVEEPITLQEDLDTLTVTADSSEPVEPNDLPLYRATYNRTADLLHTKLDVRFDWDNQFVIGKADLDFTAVFTPIDQVTLDAKNFDISAITLNNQPVQYHYDEQQIVINLDRPYGRLDTFTLHIEYVAKPNEGEQGGSAAINQDKGLYFINPSGKKNKPQQIWTQGETESNSRWFPTIDKPNERSTEEIYVTVQDRFVTLSNGVKVSSEKHEDGTRTDYWKMDIPHSPYLFMLAVGDFAVVTDHWDGIPVQYYVEPEYEPYAREIFNHTPEMLDYFSNLTGIHYPWPKFSQIIVRDYVSGAMENTTAVVFGDFIQKNDRELMDEPNDFIVAHEMFHHWFGDYVTCESWSNLTLNEGFANYAEYLWNEHKYGEDEADFSRLNEMNGYLNQMSMGGAHPLIDFTYADKEDMFDAHSYNKGGLVLHMLRRYLGDDVFFAALHKYLVDHALQPVEAHDLRLACEAVSGQDLNWFFNQWFFNQGHPVLSIDKKYDAENHVVSLDVEQIQDPQASPAIFKLPVTIDVYDASGQMKRHQVVIDQRKEHLTLPAETEPALVVFDGNDDLVMVKMEDKSLEEYYNQYRFHTRYVHRAEALDHLFESDDPLALKAITAALDDPHWSLRKRAVMAIQDFEQPGLKDKLLAMAENDPKGEVRATAIEKISASGDRNYIKTLKEIIKKAKSYQVIGAAFQGLSELDNTEALAIVDEYKDDPGLLPMVANVYADTDNPQYIPFFTDHLTEMDGVKAFDFLSQFGRLLSNLPVTDMEPNVSLLKGIALDNEGDIYKRFAATKALFDMRNALKDRKSEGTMDEQKQTDALIEKIKVAMKDIYAKEESTLLRNQYFYMLNS